MTRFRTKEIIDPSYPLLEANREAIEAIEAIRRETFSYGPLDEHKLDVYYPPTVLAEDDSNIDQRPVLVFFYGGGFTSGSRSSPPSNLVHNNLGAFFASRGVVTVIPDYRLVPEITFPQGGEDVQRAVLWAVRRFTTPITSDGTEPTTTKRPLFVMGHSAGGVHLATLLLTPALFSPLAIARSVRGMVLLGVPVSIPPPPGRPGFSAAAVQYYGSAKAVASRQPLGLLRGLSRGVDANGKYVSGLPPLRALRAASEPRYITAGMRVFVDEYAAQGGVVEEFVLEGHDHLSPVLALCTGSGENWAEELVKWIMLEVEQPRF